MTLWLCGQWEKTHWEFQGVFSTREKAIFACLDDSYFIAPVKVDQIVPSATAVFPGAFYPLAVEPSK